jgi:hypothetical protein
LDACGAAEQRRHKRLRDAARLHWLGPRPVAEFVDELAREYPALAPAIDARLGIAGELVLNRYHLYRQSLGRFGMLEDNPASMRGKELRHDPDCLKRPALVSDLLVH